MSHVDRICRSTIRSPLCVNASVLPSRRRSKAALVPASADFDPRLVERRRHAGLEERDRRRSADAKLPDRIPA